MHALKDVRLWPLLILTKARLFGRVCASNEGAAASRFLRGIGVILLPIFNDINFLEIFIERDSMEGLASLSLRLDFVAAHVDSWRSGYHEIIVRVLARFQNTSILLATRCET